MLCAIKKTKEKKWHNLFTCFGKWEIGNQDLKRGFGGGCCYYIYFYIYFNRKENGKFANLK